jgi:site-specific recombinase XerC
MLPEIEKFQKWLRRKSPHASTHIHYVSDVRLFFAWASKSPGEVTVRDVDVYIEHSQREGHAIATVNRRLASLRSFYLFLTLDSDDAPPNPVNPGRHFIRHGERLPRDVEDSELQTLFDVIQNLRDRAMFILMLRCGLRVGEVRNLTLGDLYLQPSPGSLPRLWLHGKGDKYRVVYLASQPHAALLQWLDVRPKVADQAVFVNRFGKQITVTGIQDRLAHYCQATGLWLTCHQFRHTLGRHLLEARVPVTSIQKLFGHVRLETTELYLHITNRQVQSDYDSAMQQVADRLLLKGGAA